MRIAHLARTSLISLVTVASFLTPAVAHAAGTPSLFFEKATVSAANGSNVSLPLHIDGNGTPVNAVLVVATYSADQLTYVGLDKSGSFFDTFVPANPKVEKGKITFSVASLGKTTDSDVLVSRLVFTVNGSSGTGKVAVTESEASNNGSRISLDTSSASVQLSGSNQSPKSTLSLSNISVTDITTSNGAIRWHTAVPASSSVDYGDSISYGSTVGSEGLTTDHIVYLGSIFSSRTTVHFRVMSVSADNNVGISTDKSFTTQGYTLHLIVKDKGGKPISGTKVTVGDGKEAKTDANGAATVVNIAGGNQKVYIGENSPQIITVKETSDIRGKAATQEFQLVAKRSSIVGPTGLLALLFIVLASVLFWAWRKRNVQTS
jgi:hypothetical protein